ncbi:MAG: hypothetical protein ACQETE_01100 [Bacteroidota bacterium]
MSITSISAQKSSYVNPSRALPPREPKNRDYSVNELLSIGSGGHETGYYSFNDGQFY